MAGLGASAQLWSKYVVEKREGKNMQNMEQLFIGWEDSLKGAGGKANDDPFSLCMFGGIMIIRGLIVFCLSLPHSGDTRSF